MTATLAAAFAQAMTTKDHDLLRELLHPELDFQAMTPRKVWDAKDPEGVVATVRTWFDDDDHIETVEAIETDEFADRQRAGYRVRIRNSDGEYLVEQQAYLSERDGQIGWLRVMCAGTRPVE
jgi:hypothetical protein